MKLLIDTDIKQTQRFEVAAWWEEWVLDHGTFSLERKVDYAGDFGGRVRKISYTATIPATKDSDYFQSFFGGNAVGAPYDTTQSKGNRGRRHVSFTPVEALLNPKITIPEEMYDQVLKEAITLLRMDIDTTMNCLESNKNKPQWMSSHAKRLADLTEMYSRIDGVIGRREYNKNNNEQGWDYKETHLT